ncbi:MAG TPA: porin family protein [Gemmatimonadaceae bacterium]|nr:porin family protein [Gemmatimonadaceae bacterium]
MKHLQAALAVLILTAASATVEAQAGIGIKAGLSYGNVSNSGALPGNVSQRSGFAVGAGATIGSPIGLAIEALYAQRGVVSAVAGASRKLNYFDVPVYLRVSLPVPTVSPFVYAGPQASFELGCESPGGSCPSGRPKTTYAGVIGGGLRFSSLHGISLDARYIYGLTDLKLSTISTTKSYQTRSFMLLAGIGI